MEESEAREYLKDRTGIEPRWISVVEKGKTTYGEAVYGIDLDDEHFIIEWGFAAADSNGNFNETKGIEKCSYSDLEAWRHSRRGASLASSIGILDEPEKKTEWQVNFDFASLYPNIMKSGLEPGKVAIITSTPSSGKSNFYQKMWIALHEQRLKDKENDRLHE